MGEKEDAFSRGYRDGIAYWTTVRRTVEYMRASLRGEARNEYNRGWRAATKVLIAAKE